MGQTEFQTSDQIVVERIQQLVSQVENVAGADFLAYSGPMIPDTSELFKHHIESRSKHRRRVLVWIETNGGFVESTERTAEIIRHHYRTVDFLVTSWAMSAGTILVMSGDSITMDYSATLGPIDPQIARPSSNSLVPALGYLEQYERLIKKSEAGTLTSAELAYLLQKFDAAELYQFEQARDLSIALLEEWLVRYKFKNWKVTEGQGVPVTKAMRRQRAVEIARKLNDTSVWHSHSRGISMSVLRSKLKLQIDDLDDTPNLASGVSAFTELFNDYRGRMGHVSFAIASTQGYTGL